MGDQLTDEEIEILKQHFYLLNPQGPKINHVPGLKNMRIKTADGWQEIPSDYGRPIEMSDKDKDKDSIPPPPPEPPPPPPDEKE